nr:MAG: hypothetical protein 4 [Leviviridae sp.]
MDRRKKRPGPARSHNSGVPRALLEQFVRCLGQSLHCELFDTYVSEGDVRPGSIEPRMDCSPDQFAIGYLAGTFLSKYDDGKPSKEKEEKTWERFFEAEEICRQTNERLTRNKATLYSTKRTGVWSILESASRKIAHILGPFSWNEAAVGFRFGPGASTRLPRSRSAYCYKYSGIPETTSGNAALAMACISAIPLWEQSLRSEEGTLTLKEVLGNRITTVPKNYKTDRTIAIEPDMNMYVQLGIGAAMRRRLRFAGCDLNDQTRNQRLALVGSLAGSLATIDLSMASDTVARELVHLLLPPDWVDALEQCRSPYGVLPSGDLVYYQKFSSMGNGYTFELESVIFYGLALAVREAYGVEDTRVSVYGDDIIVPTQMAEPLISVLREVGFVPNPEKSFWSGPFRESCGKHYFSGHDVTPFYVRKPLKTLRDLFLLHNNLYRWICRVKWARVSVMRYRGCWESISRPLPDVVYPLIEQLREHAPWNWRKPRIPDDFGDGAFLGTFDEALPTIAKRGWEGYTVETLDVVKLRREASMVGRLVASLAQCEAINRQLWVDPYESAPLWGERYVVRKHHVPRWALEDPRLITS